MSTLLFKTRNSWFSTFLSKLFRHPEQLSRWISHSSTSPPPLPSSPSASTSSKLTSSSRRTSPFDIPDYALAPRVPVSEYQRYDLDQLDNLPTYPSLSITPSKTFIENALYHSQYGYFCRPSAPIFQFNSPAAFPSYGSHIHFLKDIEKQYQQSENKLVSLKKAEGMKEKGVMYPQLWHTPTELFKPWYGYAIADYILKKYRTDPQFKECPMLIYEVGGGNGTLMGNILDYLKETAPEVYHGVQYTMIEVSPTLSKEQQHQCPGRHQSKLHFHCSSIFDWSTPVTTPCFVIALEVIDNFSHDVVRWDGHGVAYQALVLANEYLDFQEAYEPVSDPYLLHCLQLHELYLQWKTKSSSLAHIAPLWHPLRHMHRFPWLNKLPWIPNFTEKVFLPSDLVSFFEHLHTYFPHHKLILSDFSSLPTKVQGHQAPAVQTRWDGAMIPVSTYLVLPGYFDIFFPTDFGFAQFLYTWLANQEHRFSSLHTSIQTSSSPLMKRKLAISDMEDESMSMASTRVLPHAQFMKEHANLVATKTKSGENPLLLYYENASFFIS